MNKVILTLAVVSFSILNAQKKEINAAVKAVDNNDIATAQNQISAAESIINGKLQYLEPELYEGYNYAKGIVLLKSNNIVEAASHFSKVAELKDNKIFTGKDSDRKKVFFVGKKAAESSGVSNLKEETYTPEKLSKIAVILDPLIQKANNEALNAYNSKNYSVASLKFRESYDLLKGFGRPNGQLLYNSGISYISDNNNTKALEAFEELIDIQYTGVETTYTAKEKATGIVHIFDRATWDTLKKNSAYEDFKIERSKSIEQEIFETYVGLLDEAKQYDKALDVLKGATKKFPNSTRLAELQSNVSFKAGKTQEFADALHQQVSKNPNDANAWYNIGVVYSRNPDTQDKAISAYKKAIELDPKMTNAYFNITHVVMGDDAKTVENYNALRKAGDIEKANKVMDERRERFLKAIPYAEKWHSIEPNNIDAVTLLKSLYQTTRNEAKRKEFKEKEEMLQKKQN